MPFSLDPQPKENEIECARCGAHVPLVYNRCPQCGVNLYEPEEDVAPGGAFVHPGGTFVPSKPGLLDHLRDWWRRLTGKPYRMEEIFGPAVDQAALFDDLLRKVGGDRGAAERLVVYERQRDPKATRMTCLRRALARWEQDNRQTGVGGGNG